MVRSKISCLLLALAQFAIPTAGQSSVPAEPETTSARHTACPLPPIPANAEQVAHEIGVMPLVLRVRTLASACNDAHSISVEELAARQQITEAVVTASLDVDGVLAEIDHERAQILELRELLSSKRDRKINLLFTGEYCYRHRLRRHRYSHAVQRSDRLCR